MSALIVMLAGAAGALALVAAAHPRAERLWIRRVR
ncbi:hypothetical protein GMJLKIPL_4116 [Methylobacterium isbiliense]|uniref:Uncharacterized protein n=1 Tax=Methylobacterium isbiliense TaxID=315478 RepID=A0ABQ4SG11_9HYPH|nr:hypothetical protein GMJLKIPL_4116 [Methylobacterium isbiliense]